MLNDNMSSEIPEKFEKYIEYKFGTFAVKNDKNRILITFGRFSSLDVACAATELLIKFDWNIFDVANDPISDYLGEFWVFKVMNNHLIFDKKFSSSEEAIEYVEINSRCNDYNNEILHKKKRKAKYENTPEIELENQFEEDIDIPNIYFKKNLYVVKYKSNGKEYGFFCSIDEAIVARILLIENNWQFSSTVEMKFHDSFYWVFKIESNVLFFIDKFESYEDAFDCLDLVKSNKYDFTDPRELTKKIKNKPKRLIPKSKVPVRKPVRRPKKDKSKVVAPKPVDKPKKDKSKVVAEKSSNKPKKRKSRIPRNQSYKIRPKHKFSYENIMIKKIEEITNESLRISSKNLKSELNIIKFKDNALFDYYSIFITDRGVIEFSSNIQELSELEYIWRILNVYGWNLDKINKISSIHYFNGFYYIIKSFNEKLIISGPFNTYDDAENNIGFLYDFYSKNEDKQYIDSIRKHGDYYKFIEEHNGNTFEIAYQKSLETLKALIDIFECYNWDPDEFSDFNIYHYHGLYWEIDYFNYYIKLYGQFDSKEKAIEHKIRSN